LPKIFVSHSSRNNAEALALRDWLVAQGWDDLFLDIDPQRGLVAGQRWLERLQQNAQRCKAVIFLVSRDWLASQYCTAEFWEANRPGRTLVALVIGELAVDEIPAEMRGVFQLVFLDRGSSFETFEVLPPPDFARREVRFGRESLDSLRRGLAEAGLTSFETSSFPWPAHGREFENDGETPRRPYRGLEPVDFADAGVFFGRDADLVRARDLLADLRESGGRKLLVILGASGAGKSSFLRAGLLPRLSRDDRNFLVLPIVRPRGAPLWGEEGLLASLEAAFRAAGATLSRSVLRRELETGGEAFARRLAELLALRSAGLPVEAKRPTLVLPLDQAEELFSSVRGGEGGDEPLLFLTRVAELLRHGPEVLVLATIRSDVYGPLQVSAPLAGLSQVPFNLPPLFLASYREVIEGPAERVSEAGRPLVVEPALTEALLADSEGLDALPLLGFTLERLYLEYGGDGELALVDYGALGGVRGSIEAAVAEAFANPEAAPRIPADPAAREALLKKVFVPHLMGVNEANGEPLRRTALLATLPAEATGLVERLVGRRLMVVGQEAGEEGARVEVAHEALLRHWPALRRWHDQESGALRTQQEVARAAAGWEENQRAADWLVHRGARLAEAEAVARRENFGASFAGTPRDYLEACRQAEEAARAEAQRRLDRQRRQQRAIGFLLLALLAITLVGGIWVLAGRRELSRQRSSLLAVSGQEAFDKGFYDSALRIAVLANRGTWLEPVSVDAEILLGRAAYFSNQEAALHDSDFPKVKSDFSPDGKWIATIDAHGETRLWHREAGGAWHAESLEGAGRIYFSPDGGWLLAPSAQGEAARIWRLEAPGQWVAGETTELLPAGFELLELAPRGRLVTSSPDNHVFYWRRDEAGGWRSAQLEGHSRRITGAAVSPSGELVATSSEDGAVRLFSRASDGRFVGEKLIELASAFWTVEFSTDGSRLVAAAQAGDAYLWSRESAGGWRQERLSHPGLGLLSAATFSPEGRSVLTDSRDGKVRIWTRGVEGGWEERVLEGTSAEISSAFFSPDGRQVVAADADGAIHLWSAAADGSWPGRILGRHHRQARWAAFSPDGARVVSAGDDGLARVWLTRPEGDPVVLGGHRDHVLSASFAADGRIVTGSDDRTGRVFAAGAGRAWTSSVLEGHGGRVEQASFSPDGATILTSSDDRSVRLWREESPGAWLSKVLLEYSENDVLTTARYSPDGSKIVAVLSGVVRVFEKDAAGVWRGSDLESGNRKAIALFSPDSCRLYVSRIAPDGKAMTRTWRKAENEWVGVEMPKHFVRQLPRAFSRDERWMIEGADEVYVRKKRDGGTFWWSEGSLGNIPLHSEGISFLPDAERIATADSAENSFKLWARRQDGAWDAAVLEGHSNTVLSAQFSPDGRRVVTASRDRTARLWDARWLMGPSDWSKNEKTSLVEAVCREKLNGSLWRERYGVEERLIEVTESRITAADFEFAPLLRGREGEDVCAGMK
jgi:WD40 repeat protein